MALTVSIVKRNVVGAQREVTADVTFDTSYPSGGELFSPDDVDSRASAAAGFHSLSVQQKTLGNRICTYDYTNKKLQLWTALGTEAVNATDQSTIIVRVVGRYGQVS